MDGTPPDTDISYMRPLLFEPKFATPDVGLHFRVDCVVSKPCRSHQPRPQRHRDLAPWFKAKQLDVSNLSGSTLGSGFTL